MNPAYNYAELIIKIDLGKVKIFEFMCDANWFGSPFCELKMF